MSKKNIKNVQLAKYCAVRDYAINQIRRGQHTKQRNKKEKIQVGPMISRK